MTSAGSPRTVAVVLDAANIAADNHGKTVTWQFARVEQVKARCAHYWPGAHVKAIIDASVENRLTDRERLRAALQEGWVETAPGDADDLILDFADRNSAPIVSRDNFVDARRIYPWLDQELDRVWTATWHNGEVVLEPRTLRHVTDEEVEEARQKKEHKAGVVNVADEQWLCTSPPGRCQNAGQPTKVHKRGDVRYCRFCSAEAEELHYAPASQAGPPTIALNVDGREINRFLLSSDGLLLGRGASSRPDVTDITAELATQDADQISRRHLLLELDDVGFPVAIHKGTVGVTFLNPRFDSSGLPANNRLARDKRYPLVHSDELVLGSGMIRLVVSTEAQLWR